MLSPNRRLNLLEATDLRNPLRTLPSPAGSPFREIGHFCPGWETGESTLRPSCIREAEKLHNDMEIVMDRSRTFSFDGTAGTYFEPWLIGWLLTLVTFGIAYPWAFCRV